MALNLQSALNPNLIKTINDGMLELHNLIAKNRPLFYAYYTQSEILITDTTTNNYFFQGDFNDNSIVQKSFATGVFMGRVYEDKPPEKNPMRPNDDKVLGSEGTIKITVDASGKAILDLAQRIQYNGNPYKIDSTSANHGLLARQFYDYTLAINP